MEVQIQEEGNGKERHPSSSRMLDKTLDEEQAQQQATDKCGFLNSIIDHGKNFLCTSPQGKTKGGVETSVPKISDEEHEKEEKMKESWR